MKSLFYAGTEFVTGDEIADALLECSAALAEARLAESIDIPVREADGSRGEATFLIGPASQVVAKDIPGAAEELVDADVVARLRDITRSLHPVVRPEEQSAEQPLAWDED